jgi:hypothetical protein
MEMNIYRYTGGHDLCKQTPEACQLLIGRTNEFQKYPTTPWEQHQLSIRFRALSIGAHVKINDASPAKDLAVITFSAV